VKRFYFWIFSALLFFKPEVFHFFMSLTSIQWIFFLGTSFICLLFSRRKIKYFFILSLRKLKYFNLKKYLRELSRWFKPSNSDLIGKSLVSWLEAKLFIKLGCIYIASVFAHYPSSLTTPIPIAIFLLIWTAYSLTALAFRKVMLISAAGLYSCFAFLPYAIFCMSHGTGINLFKVFLEPFPIDVIYLLDVDISNLMQTANKLFLFTASLAAFAFLFLFRCSVVIRSITKLILTLIQKCLNRLVLD
jgi:hypothetical protein